MVAVRGTSVVGGGVKRNKKIVHVKSATNGSAKS
jgi:hypothetical protein